MKKLYTLICLFFSLHAFGQSIDTLLRVDVTEPLNCFDANGSARLSPVNLIPQNTVIVWYQVYSNSGQTEEIGRNVTTMSSLMKGTYVVALNIPGRTLPLVRHFRINGHFAVVAQGGVRPLTSTPDTCEKGVGKVFFNRSLIRGGTPPFRLQWSNGSTEDSITNLRRGVYYLQVYDALNCPAIQGNDTLGETVGQYTPAFVINRVSTVPFVCNGTSGSITVQATGGLTNGPYSYHWQTNPPVAGPTLTGIRHVSSYSVVARDLYGCTTSNIFEVRGNTAGNLRVSITAQAKDTCLNGTGRYSAVRTGGRLPIKYRWSRGDTTQTIINARADNLAVTITDADGCVATSMASISTSSNSSFYFNPLSVQTMASYPGCDPGLGEISVSISGQRGRVRLLWSDGDTTFSRTNLNFGSYHVTARDERGCITRRSIGLGLPMNCMRNLFLSARADYDEVCSTFDGFGLSWRGRIKTPTGTFWQSPYSIIRNIPPGNYTLYPDPVVPIGDLLCPADSLNFTVSNAIQDYSFTSIYSVNELYSDILPGNPINTGQNRPGFTISQWPSLKNVGTLAGTGKLSMRYPEGIQILSGSYEFIDQNTRTIYFSITNVPAMSANNYSLRFRIDSTLQIGHVLRFKYWSESTTDNNPANDTLVSNISLGGSFDPNDKLVYPSRANDYIGFDENLLQYTIRFQNTGNLPAIFVRLLDTLDKNLLPTSIHNIQASHPYAFEIVGDGILRFFFDNIMLPDSGSNEPDSHGFVTFDILRKKDLPIGTEIFNKAAIFFDFNPPIITNQVRSVVHVFTGIEPKNQAIQAESWQLFPNPNWGIFSLRYNGTLTQLPQLEIYDLMGKVVRKTNITLTAHNQIDVQLHGLIPGLYHLRIPHDGRIETVRFQIK